MAQVRVSRLVQQTEKQVHGLLKYSLLRVRIFGLRVACEIGYGLAA